MRLRTSICSVVIFGPTVFALSTSPLMASCLPDRPPVEFEGGQPASTSPRPTGSKGHSVCSGQTSGCYPARGETEAALKKQTKLSAQASVNRPEPNMQLPDLSRTPVFRGCDPVAQDCAPQRLATEQVFSTKTDIVSRAGSATSQFSANGARLPDLKTTQPHRICKD